MWPIQKDIFHCFILHWKYVKRLQERNSTWFLSFPPPTDPSLKSLFLPTWEWQLPLEDGKSLAVIVIDSELLATD